MFEVIYIRTKTSYFCNFLHRKFWAAASVRLICQYVDTQPTRAQPLLLLASFNFLFLPLKHEHGNALWLIKFYLGTSYKPRIWGSLAEFHFLK